MGSAQLSGYGFERDVDVGAREERAQSNALRGRPNGFLTALSAF